MKKDSLTDAHFGYPDLNEVSNKLNQKPSSREFGIYIENQTPKTWNYLAGF